MFCITSSFYKYPSGWQVRTYTDMVGIKDWKDMLYKKESRSVDILLWNEEIQENVSTRVLEKKFNELDTWINPFTLDQELGPTMITEYDEKELERKKQHSLRSSMGRTVNVIYDIARSNLWDWFITLTFNPDIVDSFDYQACVKKLSVWLMHVRKENPDLGYIMVPEKHESGRYHFHGLFKNCEGLGFTDSGHKDKTGAKIYNIGRYKYGWTTATAIKDQSRVTKYIAKYINKDLCQTAFGKKRYWASKNLDKADVQEVILDAEKMKLLKEKLANSAVYIKKIESAGIETTYYELGKEVLDYE